MGLLDEFIPVYYQVRSMCHERNGGDVVTTYNVSLRNAAGNRMGTVNPGSVLTEQERQAIAAIFIRDKAQFEAATGLTEWKESEE